MPDASLKIQNYYYYPDHFNGLIYKYDCGASGTTVPAYISGENIVIKEREAGSAPLSENDMRAAVVLSTGHLVVSSESRSFRPNLFIIDPRTNFMTSHLLPGRPKTLLVGGDDNAGNQVDDIFISFQDENRVSRWAWDGKRLVCKWGQKVGDAPRGLGYDRVNRLLWVACKTGDDSQRMKPGSVYLLDSWTGRVLKSFPVPYGVRDIVIDSLGQAWVTVFGTQEPGVQGDGDKIFCLTRHGAVRGAVLLPVVEIETSPGSGVFHNYCGPLGVKCAWEPVDGTAANAIEFLVTACTVSERIVRFNTDGEFASGQWNGKDGIDVSKSAGTRICPSPLSLDVDGYGRIYVGSGNGRVASSDNNGRFIVLYSDGTSAMGTSSGNPVVSIIPESGAKVTNTSPSHTTGSSAQAWWQGDSTGYKIAKDNRPTADSDGDTVTNDDELRKLTMPAATRKNPFLSTVS